MEEILTNIEVTAESVLRPAPSGAKIQSTVSVDDEVCDGVILTRNQNKRKREMSGDSWQTPSRPKTAKCTTPKKKLVSKDENEIEGREGTTSNRGDGLDQLNPVALPEKVAALFSRPHVFPKQRNHEILKGIGFPPKLYMATASNQTSIVRCRNQAPGMRVKQPQRNFRKTSVEENLFHGCEPQSNNSSALVVKPDGRIIVNVQGEVIIFPVCSVSLTMNSVSREIVNAVKNRAVLQTSISDTD